MLLKLLSWICSAFVFSLQHVQRFRRSVYICNLCRALDWNLDRGCLQSDIKYPRPQCRSPKERAIRSPFKPYTSLRVKKSFPRIHDWDPVKSPLGLEYRMWCRVIGFVQGFLQVFHSSIIRVS